MLEVNFSIKQHMWQLKTYRKHCISWKSALLLHRDSNDILCYFEAKLMYLGTGINAFNYFRCKSRASIIQVSDK